MHLSKLGKQKNKKTHYIIHCPTQSHRLELFTVGWLQNKSVKWVRAFKSVSSEFYLPWPKIVHLSGVEPCDLHHMKGKKTINKHKKKKKKILSAEILYPVKNTAWSSMTKTGGDAG